MLADDGAVDEARPSASATVLDLETDFPHHVGAGGRDRRATLEDATARIASQLGESGGSAP